MRKSMSIAILIHCLSLLLPVTAQTPSRPKLLFPPNDSIGIYMADFDGSNCVLQWQAASGASKYRLVVSMYENFSAISHDTTMSATCDARFRTTQYGKNYYWRVEAISATNDTSSWSTTWNFRTTEMPGIPILLAPPDNGTTEIDFGSLPEDSCVMNWYPSPGGVAYRLQIGYGTTFIAPWVFDDTIINDNCYPGCRDLDRGTIYYWRVASIAENGDTSDWSLARRFYTKRPAAPVTPSPAHGSVDVVSGYLLSWSPNSIWFCIDVNTTSSFPTDRSIVDRARDQRGTHYFPKNLLRSTTYYWRVMIADTLGSYSTWSPTWKFTTAPEIPAAPSVPTHKDSLFSNQPIRADWGHILDWKTYQVQVATDPLFKNVRIDTSGIAADAFKATDSVATGTRHFWRVRCTNGGGTGPWSKVMSLVTALSQEDSLPRCPIRTFFTNNSDNEPILKPSYTNNQNFIRSIGTAAAAETTLFYGTLHKACTTGVVLNYELHIAAKATNEPQPVTMTISTCNGELWKVIIPFTHDGSLQSCTGVAVLNKAFDGYDEVTVSFSYPSDSAWIRFDENTNIDFLIGEPPVTKTTLKNATLDEGDSMVLHATATGANLIYQWQKNGENIAAATTADYTIPPVKDGDHNATYRCLIGNGCGTDSTNSATLTVVLAPPVISRQPTNAHAKEGESATFTLEAAGTSLRYQWMKDGEPIEGATGLTYTIPSVENGDYSAWYHCVIANRNHEIQTDPVRIEAAVGIVSIKKPLSTISTLTNKLIAVPNPASLRNQRVEIVWSGVHCEKLRLVIFDKCGNVVNTVMCSNVKALNDGSDILGYWNLRNIKGRIVAPGTYLILGQCYQGNGKACIAKTPVGVVVE